MYYVQGLVMNVDVYMYYKLLGLNLDCKVKKGVIGILQCELVRILSSGM